MDRTGRRLWRFRGWNCLTDWPQAEAAAQSPSQSHSDQRFASTATPTPAEIAAAAAAAAACRFIKPRFIHAAEMQSIVSFYLPPQFLR